MLGISDLKVGTAFMMDGDPYEVLESKHVLLGRGRGHLEARIRNLRTGNVFQRSLKPSDAFEEADLEKKKARFLFGHRGQYTFAEDGNPKNRFMFTEEQLGDIIWYLAPNLMVEALLVNDQCMNINLPPKVDLKVTEAPPGIRGDTAQGGTKTVVCETGLKLQAPLFIEEGEVIRINTKSGEYVERVK